VNSEINFVKVHLRAHFESAGVIELYGPMCAMLGCRPAVQHLEPRNISGDGGKDEVRITCVSFVAPIAVIDGLDGDFAQGLHTHTKGRLAKRHEFHLVLSVQMLNKDTLLQAKSGRAHRIIHGIGGRQFTKIALANHEFHMQVLFKC
jgi:hypothetical protein